MHLFFLAGVFTYFGYTDIVIDYLYGNIESPLARPFFMLFDFLLSAGHIFELCCSFLIVFRLLHYPIPVIFGVWISYLEHLLIKLNKMYKSIIGFLSLLK